MKKIFFLLVLLVLILSFYLRRTAKPVKLDYQPEFFYLGGIQINEADNREWASLLNKLEMNTVEVTVYAHQGKWDSDSLAYDSEDYKVLDQIQTAKEAGLRVVLILRVDLDHSFKENKFLWHGMIMPKDSNTLQHWFGNYIAFATKWAKIAQEEGVDVFGIGSEMSALSSTLPIEEIPSLYAYYNNVSKQNNHEKRALRYKSALKIKDMWINGYTHKGTLESYIAERIECKTKWANQITFKGVQNRLEKMNARRKQCSSHWRNVIKAVRKYFTGDLTYAANFDNYLEIDFWDRLDFIGINAYFSLRKIYQKYENDDQFLELMKTGWNKAFDQINSFRQKQRLLDKPLFFTELGYINRVGCTVHPWQGFGYSIVGYSYWEELIRWTQEPYDYRERDLAMQALYEVVKAEGINLEGLLYWKLTSHDYHMPYEPFALHLTPEGRDSLQRTLAQFTKWNQSSYDNN